MLSDEAKKFLLDRGVEPNEDGMSRYAYSGFLTPPHIAKELREEIDRIAEKRREDFDRRARSIRKYSLGFRISRDFGEIKLQELLLPHRPGLGGVPHDSDFNRFLLRQNMQTRSYLRKVFGKEVSVTSWLEPVPGVCTLQYRFRNPALLVKGPIYEGDFQKPLRKSPHLTFPDGPDGCTGYFGVASEKPLTEEMFSDLVGAELFATDHCDWRWKTLFYGD